MAQDATTTVPREFTATWIIILDTLYIEDGSLAISYRFETEEETVEIPGEDFFVGVQFHPEFKSRPNKPHPLFLGFIGAALKRIGP